MTQTITADANRIDRKAALTATVEALIGGILNRRDAGQRNLDELFALDQTDGKTLRYWTAADFARARVSGYIDPSTELNAIQLMADAQAACFGELFADRDRCTVDWCNKECRWEPNPDEAPGMHRDHVGRLFSPDVVTELTATQYVNSKGYPDDPPGGPVVMLRISMPEPIHIGDPADIVNLTDMLDRSASMFAEATHHEDS